MSEPVPQVSRPICVHEMYHLPGKTSQGDGPLATWETENIRLRDDIDAEASYVKYHGRENFMSPRSLAGYRSPLDKAELKKLESWGYLQSVSTAQGCRQKQ